MVTKINLASAWPGKSNERGETHAALWHMLDVAAVAEALIVQGPLAHLEMRRQQAVLFLIALHDLGKISAVFRAQIRDGRKPLDHERHWRLSDFLLHCHDLLIAGHIGGTLEVREILRAAVAGHHGRPPPPRNRQQKDAVGTQGRADSAAVIDALAPLFAPASLDGIGEHQARRLSWLVSGLTVQADWVGSNSRWFPFADASLSIEDYWRQARAQVPPALAEAGLLQSRLADLSGRNLVGGALRPMQAAVDEVPLPDGPTLALIEDATGAGKTEAALILAHRMIAAGKARGLYFALPTTATADAMFARLRPMLRRMFTGQPSLALLHGRRTLNDGFAAIRGNDGTNLQDAGCASWLADDRRLSLLAEIGVGTVDQALMGVLPTRFNTLRLTALADRVIIVDEAHSYDPYMEAELQTALRFQAMLGGSAIVMTATLPRPMRNGLVKAFRAGLSVADEVPLSDAYPALAVVGERTLAQPVAPVPATCRRIAIRRLPDTAAACAAIADGVAVGAACLWVRNAVDDAIAAVGMLRALGIDADLLHARFATCDRLDHEARMIAAFGRDGTGRAGRVLVATQVVESSLDLDFDLMVSDLAPIGALIQRAGRLWRHMDKRPAEARPLTGPTLHVLSPDPGIVANDRWLHGTLEAGAWVYPTDVQWRSAQALFAVGAITAPEGLRALIEAVHGVDPLPLPVELERTEIETEGNAAAQAGHARHNLLNPGESYSALDQTYDDQVYPTRLGEPQKTLILTRREGAQLIPWAGSGLFPARALALSEVQMSLKKYHATSLETEQSSLEITCFTTGWKDWERAARAVAVVGEDGGVVDGLRYDKALGLLTVQG